MRASTRLSRILFFTLLVILSLLTALPVLAQDDTGSISDDEVNEVAKELYCPICESTPLDVCATQACADWREVIRTKLAEGQSPEEIKAYFELQYGPQALAEPPRSGFTLAVWILPIVAVVIGAFFFARYLRGQRTDRASTATTLPADGAPGANAALGEEAPTKDDYRSRVESELREN